MTTNENFYGMLPSNHHNQYRYLCYIKDHENLPLVDIEKIKESINNTYVSKKSKLLCAKVDGIPANTIVGEIYGHILTEKLNYQIELGLGFSNMYVNFNLDDPTPDHFNYFAHDIEDGK